jgi:hypothetical protein
MIIKAHANYRPLAQPVVNLLLDDYPNAAAAYSLRKLDKDYTGSAIRVRRSNDNSEQDIGFTSSGDLDTASLKTFVGTGNSGFVTVWYNQGDSANLNFTQTTAVNQPRIISNNIIDTRLGEPSLNFQASNNNFMEVSSSTATFSFLHKTGKKSLFYVIGANFTGGSDPNESYVILDNTALSSVNTGYAMSYDDRSSLSRNNVIFNFITRGVVNQPTISAVTANNYFQPFTANLLSQFIDNDNATASLRNSLYYNGGSLSQTNTFTNTASNGNASFNMRMGRRANNTDFNLKGYISEIIIYDSDQSSNRTGIETNINSYYGVY